MERRAMKDHRRRQPARPAYYLGRSAMQWIDALTRHRATSPGVSTAAGLRPDRPVAAVVTGAGRGLGRLVASTLAGTGVGVGLIARSGDELARSVEHIQASGGVAASFAADVTDDRAMTTAIANLRERLGPIELLVNNAGVTGPAGAMWELDAAEWWRTVEVNLRGTLLCTRLVLPDMVERRRGRIVNIASQAGAYRWPMVSAYSVSKAAVIKLSENLAWELRRHGVSVFSVHPGLLPIGLSEAALAGHSPRNKAESAISTWIQTEFAAGRGTDPTHAAELIVDLLSGQYDALSGRHLSAGDDLDALLERIDQIRTRELYLLRLPQLAA
jgi:NAD(P)-dependent dehydrogenase (short-subunit alcohol dehydrogenase family)